MLFESSEAFQDERYKRITLMGMSNFGKTRLASILPKRSWYHYSVDYRLATAYLREAMVDVVKTEMMKNDYRARHLRDDAVGVQWNATFSDLTMVSHYLGKLESPARGGLHLDEFLTRQARHRQAEMAAVLDLPDFIRKGREIYGYDHS